MSVVCPSFVVCRLFDVSVPGFAKGCSGVIMLEATQASVQYGTSSARGSLGFALSSTGGARSHLVIFGSDNTDQLHTLPHQASWRKPSLRAAHLHGAAMYGSSTTDFPCCHRKSSVQSPYILVAVRWHWGPHHDSHTSLHRKHRHFNPAITVTVQPDR